VVEWGFRELWLAKVTAFANLKNRQSWRVMEKLGMTREGVFRRGWRHRGQLSDSVAYGVLRDEWQSPAGPLPSAPVPAEDERAADCGEMPELRTARLVLRPFGPGDVDDTFEYARDPEWAEYLLTSVPQPYTRRNAEEFIARQMRASASVAPTWAIVLDDTVVGGIGLDIDSRHDTGELHYGLGRAHWGRGIMPEAAGAVADWGFGERGLAKVSAHADLRNRRSWRVMEKFGMSREGVRRSQGKDVRPDHPRTDYVYYGLLREEWDPAAGDRSGLDGEGSDHAQS
jgi:RimJ/RimL family protein N-acetyltransferase